MPKKFYFLILLIVILFGLFVGKTYSLVYLDHAYYLEEYNKINNIYVQGNSAPRGRILDIKGRILVDNKGINTIIYHKSNNITLKEEIEVAKKLVLLTNYTYKYQDNNLKDYYMLLYADKVAQLITPEEYELYKERKISKEELTKLKKERITENDLNSLSALEKYSSYFYYLMNEGYIYDNKLLLNDIDDELYAKILEANLPGIMGEISWVRAYPYEETLRSVLGEISNTFPKEKKELLKKGYSLNDKVGISGLEEYYEDYLKGEKALYKVENNNLILIEPAKKGHDLILNIDLDYQLKVEEIIKEQLVNSTKMANTKYYKESYALISEPLTGNIKAIAGIRKITNGKDIKFQDVSINVIKNAYTVGSAVKGASMAVGYKYKAIDIGSKITDGCIKLYNNPLKCSYSRLGTLTDLKALALSSNYYQFIVALRVAGLNYTYNMKAKVTEDDFNKYRSTFTNFGLGIKTGVDLPNESIGLKGTKIAPDLLLNLAIGQYDLYTPMQLLQYINTIANTGERLKLHIVNSIKDNEEILYEAKKEVLSTIDLEEKYLKRIQAGFREVIKSGTGYWYANPNIQGAGKTGTSESYIDSDYNGTLDAYVLSNTFLMYAPYDNPTYSIVVISPNTSDLNSKSKVRAQINRLIARNINDFLFSS